MALTIPQKQNLVRQRWLEWRTNPLLIDFLVTSQSWKSEDRLRAWMDMHARLACHEHGALLATDAAWNEVRQQLSYAPLWLITNWREPSAAAARNMRLHYYSLKTHKRSGKLEAVPSKIITSRIDNVNVEDLYKWLGVVGGYRPPDPAPAKMSEAEEQEADASHAADDGQIARPT